MALAQCTLSSSSTTTFPPSSASSILITRKTISLLPLSSKPTKRKNHLRPKLLKTLTKPFPTFTPLLNPQQPTHETPQEQVPTPQNVEKFETLIEQQEEENIELALENVQVSATPEMEPVLTKRSVVELVFYVVGLFVVQTVITVWVLRSGDVDKRDENEEMLNGKKNDGLWLSSGGKEVECNESVGYVDELGVKEKIVEIRAMAREVREIEAKKLSSNESVSDVSVLKPVVTKVNTNIQKEVDGKLSKLEKRLRSLPERSPTAKVGFLNNITNEVKDEKETGRLNGNSKDENLVFKKKLKFKSDSSKPRNSPKGFPGVKNYSLTNGNDRTSGSQDTEFRNDVIKNSARGMSVDLPNGGSHGSTHENDVKTMSKSAGKDEEKDSSGTKLVSTGKSLKIVEGMKTEKRNSRFGVVRESKDELVEPKDSSKMKTKSSRSPKTNVQSKEVVDNARDKQEYIENDAWWLSLPYALAILLRRSSESEGPGGLYSLKMDDGSPSYIVAFEDQRDASNFCYILEAFFNELGDLKADVVPLSIKELRDEVETMTMKIIVVRKGQLQLYAGQPLADVEMTLRTLVKQ